jgi:hypothetical protein
MLLLLLLGRGIRFLLFPCTPWSNPVARREKLKSAMVR